MSGSGGRVAKRYAKALFDLCEISTLESVRDSLTALAQVWEQSAELRDAIKNPAFPVSERSQVLRDVAARVRSGDVVFSNFLVVLLENRRLAELSAIAANFTALVDALRHRLALEISSAFPIDESEKGELVAHIEREFGSMATVAWDVRPELIGGLIVKAGDKMLDTSVSGALEGLREKLIS